MIITIIAWIYISFLSWTWGTWLMQIFGRVARENDIQHYHFSITCLTGLAVIGTIAQVLSLFYPLGTLYVQLLFLTPSLILFFFYLRRKWSLEKIINELRKLTPVGIFILVPALLLILVMSVHPVYHPDTLAYHSQIIKWIEQYPAVPGLVHLNYHYGYQNSWFILCGLFSFKFAGSPGLTFVNTAVLSWWVLFISYKISSSLNNSREDSKYTSFLWLALFTINLWAFTQLRLTASSASPDFICTLYILLIGYLFIKPTKSIQTNKLLIIFLCFFAITLKLAALPVALFALTALYPFRKITVLTFITFFLVVLVPFLIRNIIITGYPLFPSALLNISHADWKYDRNLLPEIKDYVTVYARLQDPLTPVSTLRDIPLSSWVPKWFKQLAFADKMLLAMLSFCLLYCVINIRKMVAERGQRMLGLFICFCGLVFWFVEAPDPRFGMGFILLFIAFTLTSPSLTATARSYFRSTRICMLAIMLVSGATIAYTVYRCIYYFNTQEIVRPSGVINIPSQSKYMDGIRINVPLAEQECGNIDLPCSTQPINHVRLRGKKMEKGFTTRKE